MEKKTPDYENTSQKPFNWMNLQRYNMCVTTSDIRPTIARAHKITIPVSNLIIGVIEGPQKFNQCFTWILAKIDNDVNVDVNDFLKSVNCQYSRLRINVK